jgi:TolB-like protein/tetratricopeptide (TPR) repeat protein
MGEGNGAGKPSGAESQPLKPPVAKSSRPVFISYASHDAAVAQKVCSALEAAGFSCWIAPRNVVPGTMYADGIVHAIDESSILVLILSAQAVASAHVGREIERAVSKRHPVVALRIDSASLTAAFEYFLNQSQWIEGGGSDAAIAQLVVAVGQHLAPGTVEASRPPQSTAVPAKPVRPRRVWLIAGAVVLVLAAAYFMVGGLGRFAHQSEVKPLATPVPIGPAGVPTPVISEKSVAVLPFVDMSEKKDQEYFSDGLSEELIDMLTKVSDLRVPARTSSFYFKGKSEDIPTIAKRLLVAHVLEGSVRKSGNHMRITVQLVRADNGYHVWSQTYDRHVDDIFKVQDEIAGAVVKALKLSLFGSDIPLATQTSNTDSYLLYLKGVALFRRSNSEDTVASVAALKTSLELDPQYAPGWAMLTRALRVDFLNGHDAYLKASADIRAAAMRAVSLDPTLPDAYVALASSYLVDWQWDKTDEAIKKALALDPGNPLALHFASFLAQARGQTDLALRYAESALVRDPLNFFIYDNLVNINIVEDRYAEAEAYFRKSVDLNPAQEGIHDKLALFKDGRGDLAGALTENDKVPDESSRLFSRIYFLERNGRRSEADTDFATYIAKYAAISPFLTASAYARRGDADQAFKWLERAYQQHDDGLAGLKVSYGFRNLHADPRYKAMLRKMNLPE